MLVRLRLCWGRAGNGLKRFDGRGRQAPLGSFDFAQDDRFELIQRVY